MHLELLDELRKTEETILIDMLEITSSEIVDAFLDKIEEKEEKLTEYIYGE